jgi:hypothetical protein
MQFEKMQCRLKFLIALLFSFSYFDLSACNYFNVESILCITTHKPRDRMCEGGDYHERLEKL